MVDELDTTPEQYTGILTPASWDEEEKVNRFGLYTYEGPDYIFEFNKDVAELIPLLLKKKVKVKGHFLIKGADRKTMTIESIEEVEDKYEDEKASDAEWFDPSMLM